MKRTNPAQSDKTPLAILTGDWHLREDQPISRMDDFQEAQWRKVDFISDLQKKYNCLVLHSGDLFHHWKPSPWLLSKTIKHLPEQFHTIFGNHDLPQHNLELAEKSGINVLQEANRLEVLNATHWLQQPKASLFFPANEDSVLVWHVMTWVGHPPYPGCTDADAYRLLRNHPDYSLIHTGHNHQTFTASMGNRILVNAGLITRQAADQAEEKPCVYLWYGGNEVEQVTLPFKKGVVSRDHINKVEDRDERIHAFISRLNDEWEASISFEENLERFFSKNNVRISVQGIVKKAMDV